MIRFSGRRPLIFLTYGQLAFINVSMAINPNPAHGHKTLCRAKKFSRLSGQDPGNFNWVVRPTCECPTTTHPKLDPESERSPKPRAEFAAVSQPKNSCVFIVELINYLDSESGHPIVPE